MHNTVFYKLKMKKNKTVSVIFNKMQKSIKKRGATKNWKYSISSDEMIIDFSDGKSETFVLKFNGNVADGFCKVAFPMEGELFEDDKKSEFKIFIAMLHSVKSYCTEIEVTDDYDVATELFRSLDYKMIFRELIDIEKQRLNRLYQLGFTNHEDFILAIFAEDLGLPEDFEWLAVLNPGIKIKFDPFPFISSICENYLYETSLLKKKTLHEIYEKEYKGADDTRAEVYAFILGVGILFENYNFILNTYGRGAQVSKFYEDKFLPVFKKADNYQKCELAYRLMQSIYDFCDFVYIGKNGTEPVLRKKYDSNYRYLSTFLPSY